MTTWLERYVMRRASPAREALRQMVQEFALREALEDRKLKHSPVPEREGDAVRLYPSGDSGSHRPRKLHLVKDDQARLPLEVNR